MKVMCTGISGCDRMTYLKSVQKIAERAGLELQIFDVGAMMFRRASEMGRPIRNGKILDLPDSVLQFLRGIVFEEIIGQIDKYKHCMIASRTCFRWDKYLTPAFDMYYLHKLDPDIYVTIIDTFDNIEHRLAEGKWAGRLTLGDILIWREEETFITELLASYQRKRHYVIARDEPPEILFNLIFTEGCKKAYLSYPVTHIERTKPEELAKVQSVLAELRKFLIVFDPLAIKDLEHAKKYMKHENAETTMEVNDDLYRKMEDQTVIRDHRLINQSDMVIVYYPVEALSSGVLHEMNYAFTNDKEVYAIFPHRKGPFFRCTKSFDTLKELIAYFREKNIIASEGIEPPVALGLPWDSNSKQ